MHAHQSKTAQALNYLARLQVILNTQSTDGNADPVFWGIEDFKDMPTDSDHADKTAIYLPMSNTDIPLNRVSESIEDFNDNENVTKEDLNELKNHIDEDNTGNIIDWIQDHIDENAELVYSQSVPFIVPDTLFLTKADAKEHLRRKLLPLYKKGPHVRYDGLQKPRH